MSLKRIYIDRSVIRKNKKSGDFEAAVTCKTDHDQLKIDYRGHMVVIYDDLGKVVATIIQSRTPLSDKCDARCWIETHNKVCVVSSEKFNVVSVE